MTPDLSIRLESVLHGLRDVIVPALRPDEALAHEQAGLILAQLSMLLHQLPYADRYHRQCRDDARDTAAEVVVDRQGGARSCGAAEALERLLAEAPDSDPHREYQALAAAISTLTLALPVDGEAGWRARAEPALLAFVTRQNLRERVWFRDAGFDPHPEDLPSIAQSFG